MANVKKEIKTNASIHNRFDIEVRDVVTGEIKQRAQAFNIICDQLYSRLFSNDGYGLYVHYGSGTGTPAKTDTSLFHFEGALQRPLSYVVSDQNGVAAFRSSVVLGTTTAVGVTITEVGLANYSSNGYLTTHAMLQDMNGNPLSILKTDTDTITIYTTIYLHYSGNAIYNPSVVVYNLMSLRHDRNLGCLLSGGGFDSSGSNAGYYPYSRSVLLENANTSARVNGCSFSINSTAQAMTFTRRIEVGEGNISGINDIKLYDVINNDYRLNFTIYSPGNYSISDESVGTGDGATTAFKTKFSYPYNATVYVNGVAAQATVNRETSINNNNIIFATAPAQGDVITIDYKTDYIPKDSDHIIDVTLTLTFGDYTGA